MKLKYKKILLATLASTSLFQFPGGIVHADEVAVNPGTSSNNEVEVNETDYDINGTTETINDDDNYNAVYGGFSETANSTKNTVTINGGTVNYGVFGGYADSGNATSNIVTVNGGTIYGVYGGYSFGNTTGNTVTINGGDIYSVYGALSASYPDDSTAGNSTNNTVIINGGNINYEVYGGFSSTGDATGNTITINDGVINAKIFGGYADSGDASNNTVNIYGSPDLTSATLFGGYTSSGSTSGNTLNIYTKGLTAQNIYGFQNINFYLPSSTVNGDTILTLSESSTDISGAYVRAGVVGNANLSKGDVITLLTNAGTITDTGTTYGKLTEGVSLTYDLTVSKSGDNNIIATIGDVTNSSSGGSSSSSSSSSSAISSISDNSNTEDVDSDLINSFINPFESLSSNVTLNPQTKILTLLPPIFLETPVIPEYDTFEEFDLEADDKKEMGVVDSPEHKGWEIFADMGGGSMKYKTGDGSYVDTKTQNADLGFARSVGNMANKVTIAPVIDYQKSDFDNYLNDDTHGNGTTKYTGGGLILRGMNHNGFYYEGSFRAGRAKTDFASDNLDTTGFFGRVTYDTTATVLNGHVKLGKYFRLNKNNLLDVYGNYYHSHQNGSNTDLSSGEHYDFSSADAGKLKIGYRLTTKISKVSSIYTGLAYQYDHNSGVTGTYRGYSTPSTKHSGSSGMIELGWQVKPLKDNPWMVDINATGWVGNQRGIKALAKVQKSF